MKYLTVIYYDTFARFFAAIEDAVKENDSAADFLHLAIFPSGWLYMRTRGRNVRLLPWQIRKPCDPENVDDEALDRIASYHAATGERYGINYKEMLRKRACDYLGTMARIVTDFRPDAVLFSGDTRIACEALQYHLHQIGYKGKRFYFEQGPNGTTIFDSEGVNANCSFRKEAARLTGDGFSPDLPTKQEKFKSNPLYRGSDYGLTAILRLLGKLPPEWDTMSLKKLPVSEYSRCLENGRSNIRPGSREILVALQVPDDANNIHHNPLGLRDVELVQWVMRASARLGLPVRVREHPLYRRRYSAAMYGLLASDHRAILSEAGLNEDLTKALVVVTVNSMTGLDAYLRKIPVVTLGNAFYDHLPGIERVRNEAGLGTSLATLADKGLAPQLGIRDPACIFAEMRSKYFLSGHYLDDELKTPYAIAEILARQLDQRAL